MKLISMTDFVFKESKLRNEIIDKAEKEERIDWVIDANDNFIEQTENYAKFLKEPLNLGMFVPCDIDGNFLAEPKPEDYFDVKKQINKYSEEDKNGFEEYYSPMMFFEYAKDRVIFYGFNFKYSDKFVTTVSNERLWFNFKSKNIFVNDKLVYTIEDVVKYQLTLTESAKKEIGCQ